MSLPCSNCRGLFIESLFKETTIHSAISMRIPLALGMTLLKLGCGPNKFKTRHYGFNRHDSLLLQHFRPSFSSRATIRVPYPIISIHKADDAHPDIYCISYCYYVEYRVVNRREIVILCAPKFPSQPRTSGPGTSAHLQPPQPEAAPAAVT